MNVKIDYVLYEVRRSKGMSAKKLSKLSGVSRSMIYLIEDNEVNPSNLVLCQLAIALGVDPSGLFSYKID